MHTGNKFSYFFLWQKLQLPASGTIVSEYSLWLMKYVIMNCHKWLHYVWKWTIWFVQHIQVKTANWIVFILPPRGMLWWVRDAKILFMTSSAWNKLGMNIVDSVTVSLFVYKSKLQWDQCPVSLSNSRRMWFTLGLSFLLAAAAYTTTQLSTGKYRYSDYCFIFKM